MNFEAITEDDLLYFKYPDAYSRHPGVFGKREGVGKLIAIRGDKLIVKVRGSADKIKNEGKIYTIPKSNLISVYKDYARSLHPMEGWKNREIRPSVIENELYLERKKKVKTTKPKSKRKSVKKCRCKK